MLERFDRVVHAGRHARPGSVCVLAIATLAVTCLLAAPSLSAFAVDAPHVPTGADTDACAMCHRAHTAASDTTWTVRGTFDTSASALIVGTFTNVGDTGLCYTCHGVDALGSTIDVQSAFTSESSHTLAPETSAYGPSPKQCSSCHDSHGSDRRTDGSTFPALLRSYSTTDPTVAYFGGDAYCATCHQNRPNDTWDGLAIWQQTAHSREITAPASGTGIVCSACHEPHGSNNPPNVVENINPPSIAATTAIPANDRRFCFACHPVPEATFAGVTPYQASSHGSSPATVTPAGEWASITATRTVGECQNCHAPMGSADAAGNLVPKLAEKPGGELCYTCHSAGSQVSSVASDMAQFVFPTTATSTPEIAVSYEPSVFATTYAQVSVYAEETTGTAPRTLTGPRPYGVTSLSGDMATGDVYGDGGSAELVVADPGSARLEVFSSDALAGLSRTTFSIDAPAAYVAVGDVLLDGSARPEVAVLSRAATSPFASDLYVYRYNGTTLAKVLGPIAVGDDASGLAAGDVTGTAAADLAVTSILDPTAAGELTILTEPAGSPGTLVSSAYATRKAPRGPSIGDAWDGATAGNEIVLANSGEVTGTVSVFEGDGTLLNSYDATVTAGAVAYDTLVANVLPGVVGDETIVALRSTDDISGVNVFARMSGGGLGAMQTYQTGRYYNSGTLAAGDVNADSRQELVVGNAGLWSAATPTEPSIQVFAANTTGDLLATPVQYWGGGTQMAGGPAGLAVADLGAVGESRHPVDAVPGAHVSTETVTLADGAFPRHVDCVDCHNVHESTATVAAAPLSYGAIKGAWGVSVENGPGAGAYTYSQKQGITYEYELCFKCHSGWTLTPGSSGDIASLVDTRNASFHSVESSATPARNSADSFVTRTPAWTSSSVLYCVDCHGNSDTGEPAGPHSSPEAPLLLGSYVGSTSGDSGDLCYRCHKRDLYYSDVAASGTTYFYDSTLTTPNLHYLHSNVYGYACQSCHVSHGSTTNERLVRDGIGWDGAQGCASACHTGGALHTYSGS